MAIIHEEKSKQPNHTATTNKPCCMADPKSTDMATIQSLLTSIEPVREEQNKSFTKGKEKKKKGTPKIDAGEKAWKEAFGKPE